MMTKHCKLSGPRRYENWLFFGPKMPANSIRASMMPAIILWAPGSALCIPSQMQSMLSEMGE